MHEDGIRDFPEDDIDITGFEVVGGPAGGSVSNTIDAWFSGFDEPSADSRPVEASERDRGPAEADGGLPPLGEDWDDQDSEGFSVISADDVRNALRLGGGADDLPDLDITDIDDIRFDEPEPGPIRPKPQPRPDRREPQLPSAATSSVEIPDGGLPGWLAEMTAKLSASVSHSFLLDFNVRDYGYDTIGLRDFVCGVIEQRYGHYIVVQYSLAKGVHFPTWGTCEYRDRFVHATGMASASAAMADDEIGMMAAAGSPASGLAPRGDDARLAAMGIDELLSLVTPLFDLPAEYDDDRDPSPSILLYIEDMDAIFPDAPMSQVKPADRATLSKIRSISESMDADRNKNCLIMTAENAADTHSWLRRSSSRVERVTVPLPDRDERARFISEVLVPRGGGMFSGGVSPEAMANLSSGLSKMQVEDIFLRAQASGTPVSEDLVLRRKNDAIKSEYEDILETPAPAYLFSDIGGNDAVKEYFLKDVIGPLKSGELWRVPMGVLLLGASGTGKSMMAMGVAAEAGVNFVNLDLSRVFDRYLGSSENNFARVLKGVLSMEPTILLIEEIDQAFPATSGDGGNETSGRILKALLEFMSDPARRGHVVVLATTNYPSRMNAALRRPGRFDKKIPFLVPGSAEKIRILIAIAKSQGHTIQLPMPKGDAAAEDQAAFYAGVVAKTEKLLAEHPEAAPDEDKQVRSMRLLGSILENMRGMTGAELETIIQKALSIGHAKGIKKGIDLVSLEEASGIIMPSTSDIQEMTDEALMECNDMDFVPERMRDRVLDMKKSRRTDGGEDSLDGLIRIG